MWVKQNAPPRIPLRVKIRGTKEYAGMMELAAMQDLGSCAAMRWGSNPHARTTILRQSIFVDCRIFFCFSEHLSFFKNPSHSERVTSTVSFASTNSAVLSLSGWLPPMLALRGKGLQRWLALRCTLDYGANAKRR